MILAVKIFFSAATVFFLAGYAVRHKNNARHRLLMGLGFACALGIAVSLLAGVYLFGGSYSPPLWLIGLTGGVEGARPVLLAHRAVATVTFLLLIVQVVTGVRRHPLHRRLYKIVLPLWLISYSSGLVLFV